MALKSSVRLDNFSRYFNEIGEHTEKYFGGKDNLKKFIEDVCITGSVENLGLRFNISPIELHQIIGQDLFFKKAIKSAKLFAKKVAEGELYRRGLMDIQKIYIKVTSVL